jgi:TIR domain-containing protein
MDFGLKGNDVVTPTIMEALAESAVLLLILSPDHLQSNWCQDEFGEFVRRRKPNGCKSQIFVVERTEPKRGRVAGGATSSERLQILDQRHSR